MSARCGSRNPDHIARRCAACKKVYRKRYRDGAPLLARHYVNPAVCAFCGIAAGNSSNIATYRYPLIRHVYRDGRQTSRVVGSIGLCDRCLLSGGHVSPRYQPRAAA